MNRPLKNRLHESKPILEELEERRLFSGGIEGLVDINQDSATQAIYLELDSKPVQSAAAEVPALKSAEQLQSREIVFVDAGVEDYLQLVDDLHNNLDDSRNFEVVVLEHNLDGIKQISSLLEDREGLDAIHIISHGSEGSVSLGNTSLDAGTLEQKNLAIGLWANAFTESGDILIYGCNLAASDAGQSLVADLGALTLADVAASDDLTGHASLDGDWELEFKRGSIEADVAISAEAQQNWNQVLAVATGDVSTGTGNGSSLSFNHDSAGADRLLLVGVSMANTGGSSVDTITYDGQALSFVGSQNGDGNDTRVEIWSLVAPNTGTNNLVVNLTGAQSDGFTVGAITFTGVDQATPLGSFISKGGIAPNDSVNVGSEADGMVFSAVAVQSGSDKNLTTGGGETKRWDLYIDSSNGASSTAPGAASVNMFWDFGNNDEFAIGAVAINAYPEPSIVSRETVDSDANGQIDQIRITTDQNLNDNFGDLAIDVKADGADIRFRDADGTVYTTADMSTGTTAFDNVFYVNIGESGSPDTDATPTVAVTANTLLTANPGTGALPVDAPVAATDDAAPIAFISRDDPDVTSATSVTFSVDFSEDVSNVDAADFLLNLVGVTANPLVVVGNAADADASTYTVTVDTIDGSGSLGLDFAGSNNIVDGIGNALDLTPATDQDYTIDNPPVIVSRETVDSDGDGEIDQIRITTSENLDDDFSGLTVSVGGGYTINTGMGTNGFTTGTLPADDNDNVFFVHVNESGTPDTDATPHVVVTANTSLGDLTGNDIEVEGTAGWWDYNWLNRQEITLDNSATSTHTDFPVLIELDSGNIDFSKIKADGADIRFRDADGSELYYEIEDWDDGAETAKIWVNVSELDATGSDSIYIYFNNAAATDDQNPGLTWNANYTGIYHLGETGTGAANDYINSSGAGNHGQGGGGPGSQIPSVTPGQIDDGQQFDSNDFIDFASTDFGNAFTIEAWVNPTAGPGLRGILSNSTTGAQADGFRFFIQPDGTPPVRDRQWNIWRRGRSGAGAVTFGSWNHVAVSVDKATLTAQVYVNGVDVTTFNNAGANANTIAAFTGFNTVGAFRAGGWLTVSLDSTARWTRFGSPTFSAAPTGSRRPGAISSTTP